MFSRLNNNLKILNTNLFWLQCPFQGHENNLENSSHANTICTRTSSNQSMCFWEKTTRAGRYINYYWLLVMISGWPMQVFQELVQIV